METETVILRFRDLVTADNETITAHKNIIQEFGYVWWGWWKKGNEKTPVMKFGALAALAKERPIEMYLIDSGQELVYKAVCDDIQVRSFEKCDSPEKEKTPEYYRDQKYFVWFKFEKIEPCEPKELKQLAYEECKELYIDKNTDYSKFNDKKIFSIRELTQQNRTVWFARRANETDLDNEIVLLNSAFVQPNDFSEKYYQPAGDTVVWLSDLHFPDCVFEREKGKQHRTLAQHLTKVLDNAKIGGLLISGDITSCAKKEGFEWAKEMIQDIQSEKPLGPENILICPGNHDFKREETALLSGNQPEYIYNKKHNAEDYSEFYHSIYNLNPNKYFAAGKKLLLPSGYLVEIAALNSVLLQQYPNFEGHGYLSQEQLDFVAENMGWNSSNNEKAIRIVMMHHHYLPTCYTETIDASKASSAVYDADRLMNWLAKYKVKLLLHGHKHKSFVSQVCYPENQSENINDENLWRITVVGMGGTGAKGVENKFATLQFESEKVIVQFYNLYGDESSGDVQSQTISLSL